jgi:hypothetical protein
MSCYRDGKPVAKSPYNVNVKEGADHHKSGIGKVVFTIQARTKSGKPMDRGGEPFTATINDGAMPAELKDMNNGLYKLTFNPQAGQKVKISFAVNGHDIQSSPVHLQF